MGGPGKQNHESVFQKLKEDLISFESEGSDRVFPSRHFHSDVEIYTSMLFVIQDQQERRPASGLLGGGSTLHIIFGISCDFKRLDRPFNACSNCQTRLHNYLAAADWTDPPMQNSCTQCISWSLDHLNEATYDTNPYPAEMKPSALQTNTPGNHLFLGPGRLPSTLLMAGWDYCLDMFVNQHLWSEDEVKLYLKQLCINSATLEYFLDQSRRCVMLHDVVKNPTDYEEEEVESTIAEAAAFPDLYTLPSPPAMWSLGDTDDKVEGIMHLSMGVQKAVFKFIIHWASKSQNGANLQRRLETLIASVQELKLSYAPCRPYKDDKFGGFTAEVYRAMCMISVWLYTCLGEDNLQPTTQHEPDMDKPQKQWTKKDNVVWLELRGIRWPPKVSAPEAKLLVKRFMEENDGQGPPITYNPSLVVTSLEIRDLVWRTFNMFRALFCTDIAGSRAQHRSTASVMHFLSLIEDLDVRIHPKRKHPIWIAKFNFLGLLRVCESFGRFNHVRNMYEGASLGEGVVKDLRPLVAKGVKTQWATNLLLAYYRHCSLSLLIEAIQLTSKDQEKRNLFSDMKDCLDESKYKRFTTTADVNHLLESRKPMPLLFFGCDKEWKAGVIVITQNHWFFCEIVFEKETASTNDQFGFNYHEVHLSENEECLAGADYEKSKTIGKDQYPFWTYGIMFPAFHNADDEETVKFALMRVTWQFLDHSYKWNEFSF